MHHRFALLPLAVAALAATGVHAQTRPWHVGVTQTFTHESDVHIAPGAGSTSDTLSLTTLRGGFDLPISRQRVFAQAGVTHGRYDKRSDLNYTGHNARAGLAWATVGNLSGTVTGTSDRQLARVAVPGDPTAIPPILPIEVSTMQRVNVLDATAHLGTAGPLGIEAGYTHRRQKFDDARVAFDGFKQDLARAGVTYRAGGGLTLGGGAEAEKTDYEAAEPPATLPERSERRGAYVSALWVATGSSTFGTRLNFGKTEYEVQPLRDHSGVTGWASWDWRPTGKLHFTTTLSREAGREVSSSALPLLPTEPTSPDAPPALPTSPITTPITDTLTGDLLTTAFTRTSTRADLRATWEATAKISVEARLSHTRNDLSGGASESVNGFALGANWNPTRTLTFGCNAAQESRAAGRDPRTYSCFGQFLLN